MILFIIEESDMKYFICCIVCALMVVGCQHSAHEEVSYDSGPIEQMKADSLPISEIMLSEELVNPRQIEIVDDSLVVLFDNSDGAIGRLLSFSGNTICKFGKRGKGHGELMEPVNFSIGRDQRSVYFYDYKGMFIQKFMLSNTLDTISFVKTIDMKKASYEGFRRFNYVCQSADSTFVGFGYNDKCRILNVEDGHVKGIYTDYPHIEDNVEYNWSFWSNLANYGISPDRKHLVTTTGIGMLFEIFDITADGKIGSKVLKAFYKPIFQLAPGAKPACVIFDSDKTFGGFKTICLGNTKFWGSIYGAAPTYSSGNEIYEFDYNGKLLRKYKVKGNVVCMTMGRDGTLYMILTDNHGKNHLVTANI